MSWEDIIKTDEKPDELFGVFFNLAEKMENVVHTVDSFVMDLQKTATQINKYHGIPELEDDFWMATNEIIELRDFYSSDYMQKIESAVYALKQLIEERDERLLDD